MHNDDYLDTLRQVVGNALRNGISLDSIIELVNTENSRYVDKRYDLMGITPYPERQKIGLVTPLSHQPFIDKLHSSKRVQFFLTYLTDFEGNYAIINGYYANFKVNGWDSYLHATYSLDRLPRDIVKAIRQGHKYFVANVILPADDSESLYPTLWEVM